MRIKRANALARTLQGVNGIELQLSEEAQVLMGGRTDQYGQLFDDDSVPLPPLDDIELDLINDGDETDMESANHNVRVRSVVSPTSSTSGGHVHHRTLSSSLKGNHPINNGVMIGDNAMAAALASATLAARQLKSTPSAPTVNANSTNNHHDPDHDNNHLLP
jgi:hypothetical protein